MPLQECPKCQHRVWVGDDGICPICKGNSDAVPFNQARRKEAIVVALVVAGLFLCAAITATIEEIQKTGFGLGSLCYGVAAIGIAIFGFGALSKQQALIKWGFLIAALGGTIKLLLR
jgi:hypothetical protein